MKKTYKLILLVVFSLIAISIFKNRNKEDLRATANLDEEFSKITFESKKVPQIEEKMLDFSLCEEEDGFTMNTQAGKSAIEVIGKEGEYCVVKTTYKNTAGNYSNECKVPLFMGKTTFKTVNFEGISKYCSIREDGSGLLELE
ncbi:hypothetical protein ACFLZK_00475 [Patescibacteria group bacterium]